MRSLFVSGSALAAGATVRHGVTYRGLAAFRSLNMTTSEFRRICPPGQRQRIDSPHSLDHVVDRQVTVIDLQHQQPQ